MQSCRKSKTKKKKLFLILAVSFLSEENLETWRQEQLEDPEISIILQGKETGIRSCWQEIASKETAAKVY